MMSLWSVNLMQFWNFPQRKKVWNKTKQYILYMSNILYTHPVVSTVKNWCWPLEDDEGRRIVCRPNGRLSQRWFITGTVTECSWQRGHGSAPHRQTGHCYLAGRSELSLLISTVTHDESTTHQRISAQPGEKACAQLSFCTVSRLQSWCQSEEGFYKTCVHFVQSDSMMFVPTCWSFSAGVSKLVSEPGLRDGNDDDYRCHSNAIKHPNVTQMLQNTHTRLTCVDIH